MPEVKSGQVIRVNRVMFCSGQTSMTQFIKYVSGSDPDSALGHVR